MSSDAARERLRELSDFAAPWAVSIAATLRLADHIDAGATHLDELAECAGVEAGGPNARILLVEQVVSEPPTASEASFDLFMFPLGGGRQRTLDEFRRLAGSAGLALRSSPSLSTGASLVELRS